jgi:hypothetical protein
VTVVGSDLSDEVRWAAVAKPGALLVMWEGIRMRPNEIAERFSTNFTIGHTANKTFVVKRFGRRLTIDNARRYQLRRKGPVDRPNGGKR